MTGPVPGAMDRTLRAILAGGLLLAITTPALANGGIARIVRQSLGPWFVTVYSSPTPLRTGEVDISVLVQDSANAVLDVPLIVTGTALDSVAEPVRRRATREEATNKLFKASKFDVAVPGRWRFTVEVGDRGSAGTVAFEADVARSTILDRPLLLTTMVLLPLVVVGWLLRRRAAGGGASAPGGRATP